MRKNALACFFLGIVLVLMGSGCTKKGQRAVVMAKQHIPAHVAGTEYKEREMDHEQWLVTVEMEDRQTKDAPVEKEQYDALKVGDRVRAKYSQGNYTHTIWAIDIEKE